MIRRLAGGACRGPKPFSDGQGIPDFCLGLGPFLLFYSSTQEIYAMQCVTELLGYSCIPKWDLYTHSSSPDRW
jgi:hypothetical protein